jgi:parvulin-like peptidyl-prolyl isomerase
VPHVPTCVTIALLSLLTACSEPPDETPLGREFSALMARPEQPVDSVKVSHVLIAFVGAKQGSESKRNYAEARDLAADVLARARAGEDFAQLMKSYSGDDGGGTYRITQAQRADGYVQSFGDVAFRLAVGEVGLATFHRSKSPYGFHVIKRLE